LGGRGTVSGRAKGWLNACDVQQSLGHDVNGGGVAGPPLPQGHVDEFGAALGSHKPTTKPPLQPAKDPAVLAGSCCRAGVQPLLGFLAEVFKTSGLYSGSSAAVLQP